MVMFTTAKPCTCCSRTIHIWSFETVRFKTRIWHSILVKIISLYSKFAFRLFNNGVRVSNIPLEKNQNTGKDFGHYIMPYIKKYMSESM